VRGIGRSTVASDVGFPIHSQSRYEVPAWTGHVFRRDSNVARISPLESMQRVLKASRNPSHAVGLADAQKRRRWSHYRSYSK
jgi:hypothetical protein